VKPESVTITATLADDITLANKKNPGDTITYTLNVTNSGTSDATGINFSNIVDSHTTLLAGSGVLAIDDAYNTTGNVTISVAAPGLLNNDRDITAGNNTGMTTTAATVSSSQCAACNNVTIGSDGSFTYDPPVGFTGTDTFTYTAVTSGGKTATATVRVTISGMIWFIKNDAPACTDITTGCGRMSHPFSTLAAFQAVNDGGSGPPHHPANNDTIFIYTGSGNYTGGVTLRNGQQLIGQGVALVVNANVLVAAGTKPQITNTTAASDVVTLADGNTVKGLTITGATRDGIAGSSHAGFTGDTLTIQNNTSSGLHLTSMTGTVTVTNTTISGNASGLDVDNGTAAISLNNTNTITANAAQRQVSIQNRPLTAGTIDVGAIINDSAVGSTGILINSNTSGTINFTGSQTLRTTTNTAVNLTTNTGTTINFSGTLGITTTTGIGLNATGGGTLNVTGTANVTTGAAANGVNINGVTMGGSGATFNSVNTTGATTGVSLTSIGNGNVTINGGTISGGTTGLSLSTLGTSTVTLSGVSLTGSTTAISGSTFGTLTVSSVVVSGTTALSLSTGALTGTFTSVTSSGGTNGVNLTSVTGNSTFGTGSLSGASGPTFLVSGGTAGVTYSGTIGQANANPAVSITGHGTGTLTFGGNITGSFDGADLFFDNADGTYNFNATNTFTNGAGINITNGSGGTFSFSSGTAVTNGLVDATDNACFRIDASAPNVTYSGNLTKSGTSAGALVDITNEASGTITFQTGTLSSTSSNGTGINLNNADGTVNFSGTTTLNAGTAHVDINTGSGGTFSFNSNTTIGATTSPATAAFNVSGGTPVIKYDGTITQTTGNAAVSIASVTGGATNSIASPYSILFSNTITKNTTAANAISVNSNTGGSFGFTGNITASTSTANALNMTTNTGATMTYTGTLALTTTTGTAFNATGGGTVNATGAASTVSAVGGIGVNIANTTIGAGNVTFFSVNANGGSAGISIDTTGTSGAFIVTGNTGSTTKDNTGGTIQAMTGTNGTSAGHGIYLNSTKNVSLKHMSIQNNQGDGIHGNAVNGATIQYCNIGTTTGNGNTTAQLGNFHGEGDVQFVDLTTSALIDNNAMSNAFYNTLSVFDNNSTSINRIVITNNSFGTQSAANGNDGCTLQATGGTFNATFSNNSVTWANGDTFQLDMHGTISADLIMQSNTIGNTAGANIISGGGGVTIGSGAASDKVTFTFNISSNTFTGAAGAGLGISTGQTGVAGFFQNYSGSITNNTFGNAGVTDSGSTQGGDLSVIAWGSPFSVSITGNHLFQYNPAANGALQIQAGNDGPSGNVNANTANLVATVTGNTISNPGSNASNVMQGIAVDIGPSTGDTAKACLTMYGNTLTGSGKNGGSELRVRQRNSTFVGLLGNGSNYSGAANDTTAVVNFETSQNTVTSSAAVSATTNAPGGYQGTCPLMLAFGGVEAVFAAPSLTQTYFGFSLNAPAIDSRTASVSSSLTRSELDGIVSAAIARWSRTGLTAAQLAEMRALKFDVADLTGEYLGQADGNTIFVDRSGRNEGWFVDATPQDDSEFGNVTSSTRRYTDPMNAAAGHIDLLTAIEHEIGHKLGLDDSYSQKDRDSIMYGYLTVGERRLPAFGQARGAEPRAIASAHFPVLGFDRGDSLRVAKAEPSVGLGIVANLAFLHTPDSMTQAASTTELRSTEASTSSGTIAAAGVSGESKQVSPMSARLKQALHPVASFAAQLMFVGSSIDNWLTPSVSAASSNNESAVAQLQPPATAGGSDQNSTQQKGITPSSGEAFNASIGTLHAGESAQITFQVTIDTPPLVRSVSTQGTVTGSNFTTVNGILTTPNTDDPETGAVNDATVTNLNVTSTWTGATSTDWNDATNWTPNSYVPGASNPAVNDVVIPNVGNQPNIGTTDIGVFSLNISNGRTLTITSPRILTIGGSPGGNLTLDGIISGGFLNFGTGSHTISNAGGTGSISSTNLTTVPTGSTVTLSNNLQMGALQVNSGGSITITNTTLSLNGPGAALVVQGGGTFTPAARGDGESGSPATPPGGGIDSVGSTVVYNGTSAQTGPGITYSSLTINNSAGVTLMGDSTVNGTLTLTAGDLNMGGAGQFTLTQPNTTATLPANGGGDVTGSVKRTGAPVAAATALTFGNANNQIALATSTLTSLTVRLTKTAPTDASTGQTNSGFPGAVQRTYLITPAGGAFTNATLRLHYLDSELNGNTEGSGLRLWKFITSPTTGWQQQDPPGSVTTWDTTNNWVQKTGVASFSPWTIANSSPTAANGNVSGRIVDANGNPVEGAGIHMSGTQDRLAVTDTFGNYHFDNVETNGFYTVVPSRANFSFTPAQRSFSQLGLHTDAAFDAAANGDKQNPLDRSEYFVRQQYVDFLNREPDEAGLTFWVNNIESCGADAQCREAKRTDTSAAFFLSVEFQQTGYLVYRTYQTAYGDIANTPAPLTLGDFQPDTRTIGAGVVVNQSGWEQTLETNTQAFMTAFVGRARFVAAYPATMSPTEFVDKLFANAGVTPSDDDRLAAINEFAAAGTSVETSARTRALRRVAENATLARQQFNSAFVLMQYFGYLQRDANARPDTNFDGYNFWLNKLNTFNGNYQNAEMVKAFLVSGEYRQRFPR
jgi:hypothetical protein